MTRRPAPRLPTHRFAAAEDVPADPYTGRSVCVRCGKPGAPGDAQHPLDVARPPSPAVAAAARARDLAILGETDE